VTLTAPDTSCSTVSTSCSCPAGLQCSTSGGGGAGVCRRTCGGSFPTLGYANRCGVDLNDGAGGTLSCLSCGAGRRCDAPAGGPVPGTVYNCVCEVDPLSLVCPANYTGPLYDNCGNFVRNCTG
jgi:hypothetical protein